MSANEIPSLGPLDKREIALIVVLVAIGIIMATYGTSIIIAIQNTAGNITISGEIDLAQIQTLVLVIVSGGLILLGISQGSKITAKATRDNDEAWLKSESLSILPPGTPGKRTAFNMPELLQKTLLLGTYVRKIYESDSSLTPKEQQEAIQAYEGITAAEMEALIPLTGPELATSIRAIISKHRATNRTNKDKND